MPTVVVLRLLVFLLTVLSTRALSTKMTVISTDAGASLPALSGRADILNSSLGKLNSSVTICARQSRARTSGP